MYTNRKWKSPRVSDLNAQEGQAQGENGGRAPEKSKDRERLERRQQRVHKGAYHSRTV